MCVCVCVCVLGGEGRWVFVSQYSSGSSMDGRVLLTRYSDYLTSYSDYLTRYSDYLTSYSDYLTSIHEPFLPP